MVKVGKSRGKRNASGISPQKTEGFVRNVSTLSAKIAARNSHIDAQSYKKLLQKHSDSIAFLHEQAEASLDNMVRQISLLKEGFYKENKR